MEICNARPRVSCLLNRARTRLSRSIKQIAGRTSMNRIAFASSLALAFVAGAAATHLLPQARAATDMTPQIIHVPDLAGDALGMASGTGLRSKSLVMQDGMTLSVQAGNVPKHMHPNAN